jgi:hypothetical protein
MAAEQSHLGIDHLTVVPASTPPSSSDEDVATDAEPPTSRAARRR